MIKVQKSKLIKKFSLHTQPTHNVVSTLKQRHIATLNRRCIHVENESFDDVALRRLFHVTYRRPLDVVLTSN